MKTKLIPVIVALFAAIVGFSPVPHGQENVTSLSSDQFNVLLNQSAWIVQVDGNGSSLWLDAGTSHTNGNVLNLGQAFNTSFFVSDSNGAVTVTSQINSGIGVSTNPVYTSIGSSLTPIVGVAFFAITNRSDVHGSLDQVYMNGTSYLPNAVAASGVPNGTLVMFGQGTSSFNMAFDINSASIGNTDEYYILGITTTTVPEPSTLGLAALGGVALFWKTLQRKK